jgi:hypothetical protein
MRLAFALLLALSTTAAAQGRVWPERRNYLVLGDAFGPTLGGDPLGGVTFLQSLRASAVVTIRGTHALDVTATRIQAVFPPSGDFNDLEHRNPEGDALMLSYAVLNRSRARGFPSQATFGGGVIRRNTSEAGRTRDTWIGRVGYDSSPLVRWSHADGTLGFQAYAMPGNRGNNLVALVTLGFYFRIG